MNIKKLFLQNFRNIENIEFDCHPNINVIFGQNGQGKSNLLEAISCLSIGKSFRTSSDKPLIRFQQPLFYIRGIIEDNSNETKLEMAYDGQKKKVKINGVVKTRLIDFIAELKTVSFTPDDLNIIKEGSSEKRKFIDMLLCQISKKYTMNLTMYQKIIDMRNKILKERPPQLVAILDALDIQLVQYATYIWQKREETFSYLSPLITDYFKRLTGNNDEISILYIPCNKGISLHENLAQEYTQLLKEQRSIDVMKGFTTTGPHRDEIQILFNGHDSKVYSSQGQQRLIAFALKMAEMKFIEETTSQNPVLLLDDIFSELDKNKIHNILTLLQEEKRQTFITTAYEIDLSEFDHEFYLMSNGVLTKMQ